MRRGARNSVLRANESFISVCAVKIPKISGAHQLYRRSSVSQSVLNFSLLRRRMNGLERCWKWRVCVCVCVYFFIMRKGGGLAKWNSSAPHASMKLRNLPSILAPSIQSKAANAIDVMPRDSRIESVKPCGLDALYKFKVVCKWAANDMQKGHNFIRAHTCETGALFLGDNKGYVTNFRNRVKNPTLVNLQSTSWRGPWHQ